MWDEHTRPFTDVVRTRIREAREAKGLSGERLALAMTEADYPMDKSTISRIESGERSLRDGELFAFAHVLDVPLVRLVSPLDGETAVRFGGIGLDRHEVGSWLLWGPPYGTKEESRQRYMMGLARQLPTMWRVLQDARDPLKKTEHSNTIVRILRDLWRASGIRPGVMERQALRAAMAEPPTGAATPPRPSP